MLDLDSIRDCEAVAEPFAYFCARELLSPRSLQEINRDFPDIQAAGIYPLEELNYGPAFRELINDIRSAQLESLIEAKLGVELANKPLMVTVRGFCHRRDGRIHTDSRDKIATCLLYLNGDWQQPGGRLRLLRSGSDIEDVLLEVPPDGGTLIAFRRSDQSWHGHLPYEGPRRYVMFNWIRSDAAMTRNVVRHRVSAKLKQIGFLR